MKKRAKVGAQVQGNKQARITEQPENSERLRPCWQLSMMDFEGPWGWHLLDRTELLDEVHSKLKNFESMTWAEIAQASGGKNHGNNSHYVSVDSLCHDARRRLQQLGREDLEQLFSIRLSGAGRIWGERDGRVFRVLWYDPQHQVFPTSR